MHSVIQVCCLVSAALSQGIAGALPDAALPQEPAGRDVLYISDIWDGLEPKHTQGWGALGLNTATQPPDGRKATPLQVGDHVYEKGLGAHAAGSTEIVLQGHYVRFEAEAGIQRQGGGRGSVIFEVYVDDEKRAAAGPLSDDDAPQPISVDLAGARVLRLVALDAGDGIGCDMANWLNARLVCDPNMLRFGEPAITVMGQPAPEPSAEVCGFSLLAAGEGPQLASLGRRAFAACLREGETVEISVPLFNVPEDACVQAEISVAGEGSARVVAAVADRRTEHEFSADAGSRLTISPPPAKESHLVLHLEGKTGESRVKVQDLRFSCGGRELPVPAMPDQPREPAAPPPPLPALRPGMEELLLEWDWRMQDGIGTEREAVSYATAIGRLLERGGALLDDLRGASVPLEPESTRWQELRRQFEELTDASVPDGDPRWETLWRRIHHARREIAFANPLADVGPLLFAKRVPSYFSHQLTQYYGYCARGGGGLYVLDAPGTSMECRELVSSQLPLGSYMHPEVCHDGDRILFAYCEVPSDPYDEIRENCLDRHFHLYEVHPDGSGLRQITEGPYDDFSPRELPDGNLMFISTRRGGFHRCGRGPCFVYTLALAGADGSNPRTVSFHETQEWDPAVLADGRVIYTRWDYVDRNAVHYQQLWAVRPDGTAPAIYYGNNTFNPVGVWEARQVPDSPYVMATAAAHHAMTAGSIILLDTARGVDGLEPITRLTPDAPFPESETHVLPGGWHAPGSPKEYDTPEEARRWPGHCYRSPYPLSEKYFLAAYSFDALIGEPDGNKPNMFGLYLVDAFGNKELLYRDLNIASQWPVPIRPRPRPPIIPSISDPQLAGEGVGTFFLQDVYASDPRLPEGTITRLRIVQVLPKTTPHANQPTVGFANASPGKQVLGTVPVEADGSSYFRAPAGIPLAFQALDEMGRAVQVMRSLTYLQPGEKMSCVGCHEHRLTAPPEMSTPLAMQRPPSHIQPAPDGANPLSYPILVQPVLDKHCVGCHGGETPAGPEGTPIVLTGEPDGRYSKSYNVLAKRVPFTSWGGLEENGEPLTQPGRFGARASQLMEMLLEGHHEVKLNDEEMDRFVTWMDANALFYGTFKPEDQERQLRGERIEGPALQ